jgi:hypothetical protein
VQPGTDKTPLRSLDRTAENAGTREGPRRATGGYPAAFHFHRRKIDNGEGCMRIVVIVILAL